MQLLRISTLCQEQLAKILDDVDLESIEECYLEMNTTEFNLGETLDAVVMQGMSLSTKRKVQIVCDLPDEISSMDLYEDNLRLQQVLSNFLRNAILFSPVMEDSSVAPSVIPRNEKIRNGVDVVHLKFKIDHPAPGIPVALV
ncbi:hypothetical protein GIB67_021275 [Kingdonia uniflora]|uniref:histidine kinase n=1 Tax=Kingdonia uniflora TaxID=39325 RepID=A0A7J7LFZ1_9MAGN|nr:hypothetical protein GIB67_021275 [Kingdonia uniflora]